MPRIALLCLLGALLLAAGCGGGEDAATTPDAGGGGATQGSGPRLSREEFISRGDAICRETRQEAQKLGEAARALGGLELGGSKVYDQAAAIWRDQARVIGKLDREFDELGPAPEGIEKQVDDFRSDIDKALGLAQEIATALERDEDPTALVGDYAQLIDDSNATIALAGFDVCGADAN